jgi:hypothetical protein
MTEVLYELRDQARGLCEDSGAHGSRWLVSSCSLREPCTIVALERTGPSVACRATWQVWKGTRQIASGQKGNLIAAVVDDENGRFLRVLCLRDEVLEAVCVDEPANSCESLAWAQSDRGRLLTCSGNTIYTWLTSTDSVKARSHIFYMRSQEFRLRSQMSPEA